MDLSQTEFLIREERKKKGWSQSELAERIGISDKRTISDWENGKNLPKLGHINALAKAFGCDPEYLLGCVKHPTVTTSWIAEQIPLSEKAIEYLKWIKGLEGKYPEQFQIESGIVDSLVCALYSGIKDEINGVRWNGEELYYLLAQANEEDEKNPIINHTLFIRQSFCMALGGVAFDFVSDMAKQNMKELRQMLDNSRKEQEKDELKIESIRRLFKELDITEEKKGREVIAELLRARPKLMELMTAASGIDEENIKELLEILEQEGNEDGNI